MVTKARPQPGTLGLKAVGFGQARTPTDAALAAQETIATYDYVGPTRVERREYGNGTRADFVYDGITGIGTGQFVAHAVVHAGDNDKLFFVEFDYDSLASSISLILWCTSWLYK